MGVSQAQDVPVSLTPAPRYDGSARGGEACSHIRIDQAEAYRVGGKEVRAEFIYIVFVPVYANGEISEAMRPALYKYTMFSTSYDSSSGEFSITTGQLGHFSGRKEVIPMLAATSRPISTVKCHAAAAE
ncbi:MAG: hypothetical protein V4574_15040 [Pseudomonadota bacterium]